MILLKTLTSITRLMNIRILLNRVAVMKEGQIIEKGTIENLKQKCLGKGFTLKIKLKSLTNTEQLEYIDDDIQHAFLESILKVKSDVSSLLF